MDGFTVALDKDTDVVTITDNTTGATNTYANVNTQAGSVPVTTVSLTQNLSDGSSVVFNPAG